MEISFVVNHCRAFLSCYGPACFLIFRYYSAHAGAVIVHLLDVRLSSVVLIIQLFFQCLPLSDMHIIITITQERVIKKDIIWPMN